ncbi:MAG TPA: type II toxin-antitoxin system PemK/MazF family toxin [Thermoanaerobaculia bacterium]|nr:type II toxin-antitoxin system PemK/MazF family toxin [Thermoanaerobaculia bacterium]
MPSTTIYEFGDVVLVPFPLSEYRNLNKKRPAVVVSNDDYNVEAVVLSDTEHLDLIIVMGITSVEGALGAVTLKQWREAGLLHPSYIKPALATIAQSRVIQRLGKLSTVDKNQLKRALVRVLNLTPSPSASPKQPS